MSGVCNPNSLNSEEYKDENYISLIDKKVIELAGQNNYSLIKQIYSDEKENVNVFAAKDKKGYTSIIKLPLPFSLKKIK